MTALEAKKFAEKEIKAGKPLLTRISEIGLKSLPDWGS